MEYFQLQTKTWFLPRELFLQDPTLSTSQEPIYCHILSGAMAKEYCHKIAIVAYEANLATYKWRFQSSANILTIYNIQVQQLVRNQASIKVLCQKIFFQMNDLFRYLDLSEQLYIFCNVVHASEQLSSKFRPFKLTAKMFGLNKNGACRVWINENHANNEPQHPLRNQAEMYRGLVELFYDLGSHNTDFLLFLCRIKQHHYNHDSLMKVVQEFKRDQSIQVAQKIDLSKLVNLREAEGDIRYSQLSYRPSFTFSKLNHSSNNSTEMTISQKSLSVNNKQVCLQSLLVSNNCSIPKYSLKVPNHKNKRQIYPNHSSQVKAAPNSFFFQRSNSHLKQAANQLSPAQSLGINSRVQESILIESEGEEDEIRESRFDINSLQKLGKIGRFCESMRAEDLILQEFKHIYE